MSARNRSTANNIAGAVILLALTALLYFLQSAKAPRKSHVENQAADPQMKALMDDLQARDQEEAGRQRK